MPEGVIASLSSPSLSSDSSLSSAPEIGDFALEDTYNSDVNESHVEAIGHEQTIEISQSKKRRRITPLNDVQSPAKRTKRETRATPSNRAAINQEVELEHTEHVIQLTTKRKRRNGASVNGTRSVATKAELNEDVEIAVEASSKRSKETVKVEAGADVVEEGAGVKGSKRSRRQVKTSIETIETEDEGLESEVPKKSRRSKKAEVASDSVQEGEPVDKSPKKTTRKRKSKEEKEAEAMPLAARTTGLKVFIGAHVSAAKGPSVFCIAKHTSSTYIASPKLRQCVQTGVHNSVTNCMHIG